jgi:excisionase family DNA binding protein
MQPILNIEEVADLLRISDRTVRRLLAANELPGFKVGGTWRFRREDINAWIRTRVVEGQGNVGRRENAS